MVVRLTAIFSLLLPCCLAAEQTTAESTAARMLTPPAQQSIRRGLQWLTAHQAEDGSFGSGNYRGNPAVTALAGMAFIASGSTPGRGPYGEHINRAVDYLLANTQQSGFIVSPGPPSRDQMYGHGFATLFLAECYGMSPRTELREKLAKAVKLIVDIQNKEGGWRYEPQRVEVADISVTVCEVMALRAARNAGLFVPNTTIDRTVAFVKSCQNPDGGFRYMLAPGGSEFERSAAAIVALQSAGIYQGPEITKGVAYIEQFRPQKGLVRRERYYDYGHYYAVQAMWHVGGQPWQLWYPAIRDELIDRQTKDGSWMSAYSAEYGTAMSLLVLQVPENYLPIIQR